MFYHIEITPLTNSSFVTYTNIFVLNTYLHPKCMVIYSKCSGETVYYFYIKHVVQNIMF